MFMQNIRYQTKKHRNLLIVVVVLLIAGLVGSFGAGGGSQTAQDLTTDELIPLQEEYVDDLAANANDMETYNALGGAIMYLASLYQTKYNEDTSDETYSTMYTEALAEAEAAYREALALAPADIEAASRLALYDGISQAMNSQGKTEEAIAEIDGLYAEYQEDIDAITSLAYLQYNLGAYEQAGTYYQHALTIIPEDKDDAYIASLHSSLASAQTAALDYDAALASMDEAIALDAENLDYTISKAYIFTMLDRNDEAKAVYDEALAKNPEAFELQQAYANFLFNYEDADAAIASMTAYRDSLAADDPNFALAEQELGYLEMLKGIYESIPEDTTEDSEADAETTDDATEEEVTEEDAATE